MNLHEYLNTFGVMKKFFAKKIEISQTSLSNILSGRYLPNLKTAIKIEKETNGKVSIYDLLTVEFQEHDNGRNKKKKKKKNTRKN